jgi:hypothetical protein
MPKQCQKRKLILAQTCQPWTAEWNTVIHRHMKKCADLRVNRLPPQYHLPTLASLAAGCEPFSDHLENLCDKGVVVFKLFALLACTFKR